YVQHHLREQSFARSVGYECQAPLRAIIEDREDAKAAAVQEIMELGTGHPANSSNGATRVGPDVKFSPRVRGEPLVPTRTRHPLPASRSEGRCPRLGPSHFHTLPSAETTLTPAARPIP